MAHRIALANASGIAAEAILEKLPESGVTPDSLVLLDDESRVGARLPFGGSYLTLEDRHQFDFSDCALLLLPEADTELESRAIAQGCLSVGHLLDGELPALFCSRGEQPEISFNATRLRLAGPELACLVPALRELGRHWALRQVNLSLLRSVEFRGKAGVDELASQTINLLNAREALARVFPQQIAFNLLPDATDWQLSADLAQIMGNNSYPILLQTINVPIFHGFAAAVQLCFDDEIDPEAAGKRLSAVENIQINQGLANPISDCNQSFSCVVSQLEQAPAQPSSLQFWMIADPLRYGLANNYVNVTDFLLKSFL